MRRAALAALLASLFVSGCGQDPDALVVSAKAYLAENKSESAVIQLRNALQKDPEFPEARFLLGKALLQTGDVVAAEKELRRALELQYPATEVAPPLAQALVLLGRHKEVLSELAGVQVTSPQAKTQLLTAVGQSHLALRNLAEARNAFAAALAAKPEYIPAHIGQARVAAAGGNLDEAAATIDGALKLSSSDADAWQLKGDILRAQKQPEPALAAYRKAIEGKRDFVPAHTAAISVLLEQKKADEAAKQLEALKQVAPKHAQTLYLQALMDYQGKNFAAARDAIQHHLRAAPNSFQGLVLAGYIETELNSFAQAEAHFLKVLDRAPGSALARRGLIRSYLRNRQVDKALEALTPVLGAIEKDPNMLSLAGEVFMLSGNAQRAAEYFTKAAALDPQDPKKRAAVGLSHVVTGDVDRGLRELESAAAQDSGNRADLALIASHLQNRRFDQALTAIAALEKKQPNTPLPHNLRGRALLGKQDTAAARRSFERALEIDPAYFPAAANLAQLDTLDKNPAAARQRLERVIAKDPRNAQAFLALAALRMRTTDSAASSGGASAPPQADGEAIALIRKAIAAQPTSSAPRIALIGYFLSVNDPKKAVGAAQEAVTAMGDRAEVLEHAARAYQAAGDTHQAVAHYRKLAALHRNSPQPYLKMAEVQLAAKNNDEAIESLQKALTLKPDLLEAHVGLIRAHLDAGRSREAVAVAREVQKQRPKDSMGHLYEGDIYASQKKWADAANAYRAGLQRGASSDLATRLHSVLNASEPPEAERFAVNWLKNNPKDSLFQLHLAEVARSRNDLPGAVQRYRKLLESEPNNVVALNNLAWIEGQLKDPKAIEHAERANKLAPNQPSLMDTLGVLLVDKGDHARGVELLQRASALAPQAAAIRLNYAKALIKTGQKDAARRELEELSKLGEKFPQQAEVSQLKKSL